MHLSSIFLAFTAAFSLAAATPVATPLPKPGMSLKEERSPLVWNHPGVMLDRLKLDYIKAAVALHQQPWKGAYDAMLAHGLASPTRQPTPFATVECGPTSTPNIGCTEERQDALAAYANAVAWYISGTASFAQKAIDYMNAWAATLQAHTNSNAPLQTGWSAASWARAAEIIRHTSNLWKPADVAAFENLLRTVYLPKLIVGSNSNGNWELGKQMVYFLVLVFKSEATYGSQEIFLTYTSV